MTVSLEILVPPLTQSGLNGLCFYMTESLLKCFHTVIKMLYKR